PCSPYPPPAMDFLWQSLQATKPTTTPTTSETGLIHWKLTGSRSGLEYIPSLRKIGPENAINTAAAMLHKVPIQTPRALAKGTKSAKRNSRAMGTVSRLA